MDCFYADDFQDFIRCINGMSEEEFAEMYRNVMIHPSKSYISEKFNLCRSNFINWIGNIDANTLNEMMAFCLDK